MGTTVFVYSKDNKIKVLPLKAAQEFGKSYEQDGWVHTQTIDTSRWMEYLHNECEEVDAFEEIRGLSNKPIL